MNCCAPCSLTQPWLESTCLNLACTSAGAMVHTSGVCATRAGTAAVLVILHLRHTVVAIKLVYRVIVHHAPSAYDLWSLFGDDGRW